MSDKVKEEDYESSWKTHLRRAAGRRNDYGLAACGQSETGTTGESAAGSSGESSEAAGEPVTVRFFNGNVEMVDWYNDAVERFNAESESVKVSMSSRRKEPPPCRQSLPPGIFRISPQWAPSR